MARQSNQRSIDPREHVIDFGGFELLGLVLDGDAADSAPIYSGTDDVEGTGGEVCFGAAEGNSEIVTFRALPGSTADRVLTALFRRGTCTYLAVRRRGHSLSEATYFSNTARVKSRSSGRLKLSTSKDPIEFTVTVVNPIDNDLNTIISELGGLFAGAVSSADLFGATGT